MQRVSVPGGWVDYREPEDVPERLRRRVTTMAPKAAALAASVQLTDEQANIDEDMMTSLLEFNDAVAICLVMGWSWEFPVTVEGLQELPASVYDTIVKHGQANVARLLPNFGVDPDPKAPIGN